MTNNRTARSARPNAGIKAQYRRELIRLIDEMNNSVLYWLGARYRANAPELAGDASPVAELRRQIKKLITQWVGRFKDYAAIRAKWFAKRVNTSTLNQLKNSLKEAGLTVQFKASPRVKNVLDAAVETNANLIKSIPEQYLTQVSTIVMQGVTAGRDLAYVTNELKKQYQITKKRAVMIARDQTNKATEAIAMARAEEIGVTHGFWLHLGGGKTHRESHVAMNGKRFKLSEGLYDPHEGRNVKPAELVNCRCTFKIDVSSIL